MPKTKMILPMSPRTPDESSMSIPKRVLMNQPRQDRRRRAFEKFKILPMSPRTPDESDDEFGERKAAYEKYLERKDIEHQSLLHRVEHGHK